MELVTRGEDTELDKTIAEALADPLMHMVRNSMDHGIEAPDAREAAGKPPQASITLAAYHQAGQIAPWIVFSYLLNGLYFIPVNFLFFCDVALLMTVAAIWLESPLLASVIAVGITLPQLLWVFTTTKYPTMKGATRKS